MQTDPMDGLESEADCQDHSAKDFSGLADMYWVCFLLYSTFLLVKVHGIYVACQVHLLVDNSKK